MRTQEEIEAAALYITLADQVDCVRRDIKLRERMIERMGEREEDPTWEYFNIACMTAVRNTLLDKDTHEPDARRAELEAALAEVEKLRQGYTVLERRCQELLGERAEVSNFLE